jgi:integrase
MEAERTREIIQTYTAHFSNNDDKDQLRKYVSVVRDFLKHSETLSSEAVTRYLEHLRTEGYAPGTIRWRYKIIRRLYQLTGSPWTFTRSDSPKVRSTDVRRLAFPVETVAKLIDAVKRNRIPILPSYYLALSTVYGLRREDICGIRPEHINLPGQTVFVTTSKHGRERFHRIPEPILPYVEHALPYLADNAPTPSTLTTTLYRIERAAGVEHIRDTGWHSIRRALNYYLLEAGVPRDSVRKFMRWSMDAGDMVETYDDVTIVRSGATLIQEQVVQSAKEDDDKIFPYHPFLPYWR